MRYQPLGRSGLLVSEFVLGTLNMGSHPMFKPAGGLGVAAARKLFDIAFDHGVNMIDTANMYSFGEAEEIVGELLAGRTDDILVTSKVRMPLGDAPNQGGASRAHIVREVEKSLRRLRRTHLDLLYLHQWDGITPIEETLSALDALVTSGKVRYTGVSNFSGWQITKTMYEARLHGLVAPVVQQVNYTPENRQTEYDILPAARDAGLATYVWSPLGEGLLGGKVRRGQAVPPTTRQGTEWAEPHVVDMERAYDIIEVLAGVADGRGVSMARVVLAWLRQRPGVTGIVLGARTEEQLRDDLAALELTLTEDEIAAVDTATQPPAIYPYWHRAMLATDRPDPVEQPYLDGYQRMVNANA
ncbi:aldo/keto reductase [Plantactinospora sp. WMMC1484]|uniref:aldo/keto reductase n=1 Tax=Plantactinospora sp. WMMC1484 TaxID=3404122 RepID=UPI003BF596A7